MSTQSAIRRFFSGVSRAFAWGRAALGNALVLLVAIGIVALVVSSGPSTQTIEPGSALVLDPAGIIVEERTPPSATDVLAGVPPTGPRLRDITRALAKAAEDDRIGALFLDVGDLAFVQPAHLHTIGQSLTAFKASGKRVVAFGDHFSQGQYYLASFADQVFLAPMGEVSFLGYGLFGFYTKDLLDKLKVNVHVFRAGEFKDAVEPYTRNDMSETSRRSYQALVDQTWTLFLNQVASNRGIATDALADFAARYDEHLAAADGDAARAALEAGLVDELVDADEVRVRLTDMVGRDGDGYRGTSFADYLRPALPPTDAPIAVITASGLILSGSGDAGIRAGDMTRRLRNVRKDDSVKALVVRLDTGGGSAFASEAIRRELELLRTKGKPVVVSMGSAAASGGYWIATAADRIVASPFSITGSIGVFAMVQTLEESLAGVGVNFDGVATGPLVGGMSVFDGVGDQMQRVLQSSVDYTYRQFINVVARGRGMTPDEVRAVADGRVYSGQQALEVGLVDDVGTLDDAIRIAAELAEVDDPEVRYLLRQLSPQEELLNRMVEELASGTPKLPAATARHIAQEMHRLFLLDDPRHIYALCRTCSPVL